MFSSAVQLVLKEGPREAARLLELAQKKLQYRPQHFSSLFNWLSNSVLSSDELMNYLRTPHLRMTSGAFFGIKPSKYENVFTQTALAGYELRHGKEPKFDKGYVAQLEQLALTAIYRFNRHNVTVLAPDPNPKTGLDTVFSTDHAKSQCLATQQANGNWLIGKILTLIPKYTHRRRQQEAQWAKAYFDSGNKNSDQDARLNIVKMKETMEFGDTRFIAHEVNRGKNDGGFVIAGIAETTDAAMGRSTIAGHRELERNLQTYVNESIKVYTIGLKQPFYHLDTAIVDAPNGMVFTNPCAYTEQGWQKIQELFGDKIVIIPEHDMYNFAGNATIYGNNVYISDMISDETVEIYTSRGFNVYKTPISATFLGGGGQRCMTDVFPEIFVRGGYSLPELNQGRGKTYRVTVDPETTEIKLLDDKTGAVIADITQFGRDFMPEVAIKANTVMSAAR